MDCFRMLCWLDLCRDFVDVTSIVPRSELILYLAFSPVFRSELGWEVAGVKTAAEVFFFESEVELYGETPAVYLKEPLLTYDRASCLFIYYNYCCKDKF